MHGGIIELEPSFRSVAIGRVVSAMESAVVIHDAVQIVDRLRRQLARVADRLGEVPGHGEVNVRGDFPPGVRESLEVNHKDGGCAPDIQSFRSLSHDLTPRTPPPLGAREDLFLHKVLERRLDCGTF